MLLALVNKETPVILIDSCHGTQQTVSIYRVSCVPGATFYIDDPIMLVIRHTVPISQEETEASGVEVRLTQTLIHLVSVLNSFPMCM